MLDSIQLKEENIVSDIIRAYLAIWRSPRIITEPWKKKQGRVSQVNEFVLLSAQYIERGQIEIGLLDF
jgi:hypothetical protein